MVLKRGMKRGDRGFLAAMLRICRRKCAADLADETAFPNTTGLVEKGAHLTCHVAIELHNTGTFAISFSRRIATEWSAARKASRQRDP